MRPNHLLGKSLQTLNHRSPNGINCTRFYKIKYFSQLDYDIEERKKMTYHDDDEVEPAPGVCEILSKS